MEGVNRIQYIEPTNTNFDDSRGVGTIESTTRINNPYENYCVVVDLEVEVYNRRSCGGINGEEKKISIVYTTNPESKSFFYGTDGKLTTNFTDINTVMGSEYNTSECLGLESLNITYQSWMYPEVTARFVDVRGASVMMQEEENLHGVTDKQSMYKAFFTFPYPKFKLIVKGFYGKGATFYLTVEDVKISFDSNSGNFVFDVKFIGMMYRIYTDIPMLYCCVAPYMPQGIDYWNEMVSSGLFVFKQKDSSTSPMIKFPELIAKIYSIDSNEEMVESKANEATENENLTEKSSTLSDVAQIPFLNKSNAFLFEKPVNGKKIVVYVMENSSEYEQEQKNVEQYAEKVQKCDETFQTAYYDKIKSFHEAVKGKKYTELKAKKDANGKLITTINDIVQSDEHSEDIDGVITYIEGIKNSNEVNIYVFEIDNNDYLAISNGIEKEIANIDNEKTAIKNKYQQEQNEIVEKILGFCPSVKNFYNLAFAHMDTFMHCYNEMLSTIKEQMNNGDEARDPKTYGMGEPSSNISTDVVETIDRIPPFPAIYKKETVSVNNSSSNASQIRTIEQWPEDIHNGNKFVEVDFVKELLMATKMYIEEIDKIKEAFEAAQNAAKEAEESSQTATNTMSFATFIPLNNVDLMSNGCISNPYMSSKSLALSNDAGFLGTVFLTLATRLFIYLSCTKDDSSAAYAAGKIEAINLYKALGPKINSTEFLEFLQAYIVDGSSNKIYDAVTGTSHKDVSDSWNFSDCPNCKQTLFAGDGSGKLKWNLYSDGKTNPMPAIISTLAALKRDYTANSLQPEGVSYINTGPSGMTISKRKTFAVIEDGSYFKTYGEKLKLEIETLQNSRPQTSEQTEESEQSEQQEPSKLSLLEESDIENLLSNFKQEADVVPYQTRLTDLIYKKDSDGKFKEKANDDDIKNVFNGKESKSSFAIKVPTDSSIFDVWKTTYSYCKNNYARAYMFLLAFPWTLTYPKSFLETNDNNGIALKSRLLVEGAFFYRRIKLLETHQDIIKFDPSKGFIAPTDTRIHIEGNAGLSRLYFQTAGKTGYAGFPWVKHYSSERGRALAAYFENWVNKEFNPVYNLLFNTPIYSDFSKKELNLDLLTEGTSTDSKQKAISVQNFLRNTFLSTVSTVELYMNCEKQLLVSESNMKQAFTGFKDGLKELYKDISEKIESDANAVETETRKQDASDPFKNKDIKLSTYITLKSLYDKWLANPYKGPDTWKFVDVDNPNDPTTSDFKSFKYIDSLYHDIGYQVLANTNRVAEWISSCMPSSELNGSYGSCVRVSNSVFEYLTEIAQHTGGMLIAFPQMIGDVNNTPSMFEVFPFESNDWVVDSSCFVYIYTYKPSEHLGTDQFSDDGILDLTAEEIKDSFSDDGYGIPAFGVSFGKQNQSIFKNLTLNTESTTTTEASLAAASSIASKGSEAPKEVSFFGQDLYKVRTSYSYECSFEMMGNIQVMPLMYFQLNNVPFWRGAYMIFKVSHSITPGNMVTTVTGTRINKYSLPITDGAVLRSGGKSGSRNGDNYATNGVLYQGQFVEDNTYTPKSSVSDTIDFDKTKVNSSHPLICITPAYGPNFTDKTASWKISYDLVENYIIKKLKGMKYKDGTNFNVQMCNKDGNHTTKNSCSMSQTEGFIKEFGKDSVISVVPRFNAGSSNYFKIFYGGKANNGQIVATDESKKLADFFVAEVQEMILKQSNYKEMTDGMMNKDQKTGVLSSGETKEVDFGPSLQCASVVTFNWFDAYPSTEICRKALTRTALEKTTGYKKKNSHGRYFISQGWLNSAEGKEAIATMHVNAIKKYVDTLQ